jgi:hypothetical protein
MTAKKRSKLLDDFKARLFARIHVAIVTGDNQRVAVGNKAAVTLEDNQPIKE